VTKILITGASGRIGQLIRPYLREAYSQVVLSDLREPKELQPNETFVRADLLNPSQLNAALEGVTCVAHFGGYPVEGPWETILQSNILGTMNIMEAARLCGVQRFVLASSNHVFGFYNRSRRLRGDEPQRPDSRYGVSKVCGEALASLYAYKHRLRVLVLRVGKVDVRPDNRRRLSIWLHPEDLMQLLRIGFEHPDLKHEVFFGCSDNDLGWWDNSRAFSFGYRPKHSSRIFEADFQDDKTASAESTVANFYQGGDFCAMEYDHPGLFDPNV
jgi:uronate dehydrogenase